MAEIGCMGCHQIGATSYDGSRGKCNYCHSGHRYSVEEAHHPDACAQCHTGPDHPHIEMWKTSKHGQLFATEPTRSLSPTCVTCHMAKGSHNTSLGLSFGHVSSGGILEGAHAPVKMRAFSRAKAHEQRKIMIQNCQPCHSSRFASESLSKSDSVKKEADALLFNAIQIISELRKEGLIQRPSPALLNLPAGHGELPHSLELGPDQPYDGLSEVEQRFFDMFKFHHAKTFKGAYHNNPDFTHNEGFLRLRQDLTQLQNTADLLRKSRDLPKPSKPIADH